MAIDYLISTQEEYMDLYNESRQNWGVFFYMRFTSHNEKLKRLLENLEISTNSDSI